MYKIFFKLIVFYLKYNLKNRMLSILAILIYFEKIYIYYNLISNSNLNM